MPNAFLNLIFFVIYLVVSLSYSPKIEAYAKEFPNSSIIITSTKIKQQDYKPVGIIAEDLSNYDRTVNESEPFNESSYNKNLKNKKFLKKRLKTKDLLKAYDQAIIKSKNEIIPKSIIKYRPRFILSKNFWKFELFPEQIVEKAKKSTDFSKYMTDFKESYTKVQKEVDKKSQNRNLSITELVLEKDYSNQSLSEIDRHWIGMRAIKYITGDYLYDFLFGPKDTRTTAEIEKLSPETVKGFNDLNRKRNISAFQPYYKFSWTNLIKYGPTLKEIENAMFIIIIFRFIFYSRQYGFKSALIICSIALMSTYCYMTVLQDAIAYPRNIMWRNTTIFRPFFESVLTRRKMSDDMYVRLPSPAFKAYIKKLSPRRQREALREYRRNARRYKPIIEIPSVNFDLSSINNRLEKGNRLIKNKLKGTVYGFMDIIDPLTTKLKPSFLKMRQSQFYRNLLRMKEQLSYFLFAYVVPDKHRNQFYLAYVFCGRLGKNLLPYHFEWHLNFVLIFMHISVPYLKGVYLRLNELMINTLLPEGRKNEVELIIYYMRIYHQ